MANFPKFTLPLLCILFLAVSTAFSQENVPVISTNIENMESQNHSSWRLSHSVSVGFAVGGLAAIIYGIVQNSNVSDNAGDKNLKRAVDAENKRNIGYAVGASLLTSGLIVFIAF